MGTLLESELFGHVRGAFTGAATSKVGLLEAASGGTAFFDEIGELPLEAQAKLLRVIQEKEFRPLGALHTRRSDFRIIAATNRDLTVEVEAGTFRRDLYFRLNVLALQLVPLRERIEDIPLLVSHFFDDSGGQHTLTPEAMAMLLAYSWPGNVRELGNCIRQMVVLSPDPLLTVRDIPANIRESVAQSAPVVTRRYHAGPHSFCACTRTHADGMAAVGHREGPGAVRRRPPDRSSIAWDRAHHVV
jgi:transcriptional regulator with PAS, ATPase and Fis domain